MSAPGRHFETIAQVCLPVLANVLLAAILLVAIPTTHQPIVPRGVVPPPEPAVGDASRGSLPSADFATMLTEVERTSGHDYSCEGPWQTSDGIMNWTCRTTDALASLRGLDSSSVASVDVTWFGFDATSNDLPDWASATSLPSSREAVSAWVRAEAGSNATSSLAGVALTLGAARGSLTLLISHS
jgi:hypothetical protein